jgi:phosphatidylethanolamine/phosphatidyl-N-methylethanolamine N-methyltransferase
MDMAAVRTSYARWALLYDYTFGAVTQIGRRHAVQLINQRGGAALEVGVGTGLALPFYKGDMTVTGIDASQEMLAKAQTKVQERGLSHVRSLRSMDARQLDFPDSSFDSVAAMHLLSVVPEPERVVAEMARVCRPGGQVVIVNHFARDQGFLALVERLMARFPSVFGWHSDFERARVMGDPRLHLASEQMLPPLGMMTMLVLRRA